MMREALDPGMKIVVLDDDPTGTQTVHGIYVYTSWSTDTLLEAFADSRQMFYVLTNSRSLPARETARLHREIADGLLQASGRTGRPFLLISRSDSTLRGHYPLETEVLCEALGGFDGEIIAPFFPEGGRYTIGNIHYVLQDGIYVPVGETEFARDATFGYRSSHLGDWVEEKTAGRFKRDACIYIEGDEPAASALAKLVAADGFAKIIVNARSYRELSAFADSLARAIGLGKRFLLRTAAAMPKVLGRVEDQALLGREALVSPDETAGGLIVVGSHVQRTTEQLDRLLADGCGLCEAPFNSNAVLEAGGLAAETERVSALVNERIGQGKSVAVYTCRERLHAPGVGPEALLDYSARISKALAAVVARLETRPRYLIAKGGITSSDIATDGLGIRKALVLGQVSPGIPVWLTGAESRLAALPYVIFPGNVGDRDTLADIVRRLS